MGIAETRQVSKCRNLSEDTAKLKHKERRGEGRSTQQLFQERLSNEGDRVKEERRGEDQVS